MGCCSAVNCSNRTEKGFRMYRFPTDPRRRKIWLCNMRRGHKWIPTSTSRLCEKHFEKSQFENHRADGQMKLKPNAVPTLFNVPNPPPKINPSPRKSIYKQHNLEKEQEKQPNDNTKSDTEASCSNHNLNFGYKLSEKNLEQGVLTNDIANKVMLETGVNMENAANPENEEDDELTKLRQNNAELAQILAAERHKMQKLVEQKEKLELQLKAMDETRKSFLTNDQIKLLEDGRVSQYGNETIIKALKFRFVLSVHGLEYLRSTGYPLPAYCTIMRHIQDLKLDFGIFKDVLELLAFKAQSMDTLDKYCIMSFDEFLIASHLDHDKHLGKFIGYVTLGDDLNALGEKMFVVVVTGARSKWKQVIACHVTPKKSIDPEVTKNFMLSCISEVEACGLVVLLLSSDLDGRKQSFLTSLGVTATREGVRRNSFVYNDHEIYAMPDPCHILKNLKSAMLRQIIYLPESFVEHENLPSKNVNGTCIADLWRKEVSEGLEQRFLHHLQAEDIEPDNFQKMNVGAAVRFFSPRTATALKTAVELGILPKDVLTTAHFILIIHEWFSILSSRDRKKSITSRNCDQKYIFLHSVIDLFQNAVFHEGWKSLNFAFVVATLSFCDTAEFLFHNGFEFILGHRFTQDVTENVISQIRSMAGQLPTAMKALSGVKLISVSQFVSDVKKATT